MLAERDVDVPKLIERIARLRAEASALISEARLGDVAPVSTGALLRTVCEGCRAKLTRETRDGTRALTVTRNCAGSRVIRVLHTSVMSPEVAVASCRSARNSRPNADPTRAPSPALWCPKRCESEYGVPVGASPCTPLGRSGNAVSGTPRRKDSDSHSRTTMFRRAQMSFSFWGHTLTLTSPRWALRSRSI